MELTNSPPSRRTSGPLDRRRRYARRTLRTDPPCPGSSPSVYVAGTIPGHRDWRLAAPESVEGVLELLPNRLLPRPFVSLARLLLGVKTGVFEGGDRVAFGVFVRLGCRLGRLGLCVVGLGADALVTRCHVDPFAA